MENHQSSAAAAPLNAMGGSGCPENKDVVAMPNLSSSPEVAATVVATGNDDDVSKGKNVVAADDKELKPDIVAELMALAPQIAENSKATIVGHAIDYIRSLEKTKAVLEKRMQEMELAPQADDEAADSSSSLSWAPSQTAEDMTTAAMSSDILDACSVAPPQPAVRMPAPQPLPVTTMSSDVPQPLQQPAPPRRPIITARRVGFQTWTWPDLVLSVSNDTANINLCAPRHRGMWTMVMVLSVLNKHGIEVVTAQIDSDAVLTVFNIYARVTAMGRGNSSALEVYQLAVSEILVWLTTS